MKRTRVEFDLNDPGRNDLVRVWASDADGPLEVGQIVHAIEPEDGLVADAYVARLDLVRGHAFLIINRKSLRDDVPTPARPRFRTQAVQEIGRAASATTGVHVRSVQAGNFAMATVVR